MRVLLALFLAWCSWCSVPQFVRDAVFPLNIASQAPCESWLCSGGAFLVDAKRGLLVADAHLAFPSFFTKLHIFCRDGKVRLAKIIIEDSVSDLIVLQIDPQYTKNFRPLALAQSRPGNFNDRLLEHSRWIYTGAKTYSVCNDTNQHYTISQGVVSDMYQSRQVYPGIWQHMYSVMDDVGGGSCGAPVLNMYDEVIGVFYGGHRYFRAIIPSHYVKSILEKAQAVVDGRSKKVGGNAILGYGFHPFDVHLLPACMRVHPLLHQAQRVLMLYQMDRHACCEHLQPGDILITVNGRCVGGDYAVLAEELAHSDGLECVFVRRGDTIKVTLPVTTVDDNLQRAYVWGGRVFLEPRGCRALRGVTHSEGAPIDLEYMEGGLRVLTVGEHDVNSSEDFRRALLAVYGRPTMVTEDMYRYSHGREYTLRDVDATDVLREVTWGSDGWPCAHNLGAVEMEKKGEQ